MSAAVLVMALLCLNASVLLIGAGINDRACRDAARAAAQTGDQASALRAAQSILSQYRTDGYFLTSPTISSGEFVYEDYGGDPTPAESPFVSVTTSVTARLPAPILFIGAHFGEGGTMTFRRTYTFPIVKTTINLS